MVGIPSDVRALIKHLICALVLSELQSVGARRSRVTNYALQDYDAPAKDKQEPPTKAVRRHHNTMSTAYDERLEVYKVVMSLNGWGT